MRTHVYAPVGRQVQREGAIASCMPACMHGEAGWSSLTLKLKLTRGRATRWNESTMICQQPHRTAPHPLPQLGQDPRNSSSNAAYIHTHTYSCTFLPCVDVGASRERDMEGPKAAIDRPAGAGSSSIHRSRSGSARSMQVPIHSIQP